MRGFDSDLGYLVSTMVK